MKPPSRKGYRGIRGAAGKKRSWVPALSLVAASVVGVGLFFLVIGAAGLLIFSSSSQAPVAASPGPGQLVMVNSFSLPYTPAAICAMPTTPWIYVISSNVAYLWTINSTSGVWMDQHTNFSVTPVSGSSGSTGACFSSSNGQSLYVTFYDGTYYFPYQYTVYASNGSISQSTSSGDFTRQIFSIVDNNVRSVMTFVRWNTDQDISVYKGNAVSANLTSITLVRPNVAYSAGFYGSSDTLYSLLGTFGPPIIRQWNATGMASIRDTTLGIPSPQVSSHSQIFVDAVRNQLYVVGLGVQQTLPINATSRALDNTSQPLSSPSLNTTSSQCSSVYSPRYGWIYNAVNGTNILQYNGSASLTPESVDIPNPPIPSSASCQLLLLANETVVALTSSDRPNVSMWRIT